MFSQQQIKEPILSLLFGVAICFVYGKQNRTIINVGCHDTSIISFYSDIFCKTITVDPMLGILPEKYSKIRNVTNSEIIFHGVALHSMPMKDIIFYRCLENIGISTTVENNFYDMKEFFPQHNWEIHHVPVKSLDDLFYECSDVDFLKIDAENEDVNILVGGKNLIHRNLPIIQIEHDDYNFAKEMLLYMGYEKIEPPFETKNSYYVHITKKDMAE